MSLSESFKSLLSQHPIHHAITNKNNRPLVSLPPTASLAQALRIMNDNMIVSVPVIQDDKCVAILDNVDVLNYIVKQIENIREWLANSSASVDRVLEGVKVSEVVNFSTGDPLVVTGADASLESIMKFFTSGWSHRCVVKMNDGSFNICSQFDVVKFLAEEMKKNSDLAALADSVALTSRLTSRSLTDETVTISSHERIFTALDRMVEKKVHALAVVDEVEDGKIVGNFSASDLLNLSYAEFKELNLTVREFLLKYSAASLSPVTIEADGTSLANTINILSSTGIHQVWIVDSGSDVSFPIGVASMSDVLKIANEI